MTCTPNFARLDAIVKKLEDNDEDIRQIAIDFPHSEPASRSRRLLVDESFTIVQIEREEAVAELKSLQTKWEARISALELERVCLRKAREEAQAERVSLQREKDDLQEQESKYQRKSIDLDTSVKQRKNVVAKHEQTLRKAYVEISKAYGDVTKAMGKPFDQTLVQSPQKSKASVTVADQPKQPVHTGSEPEQQVLDFNDTVGEEIATADNHALSQSVDHGPRIVDHLKAKQLSLPLPSRRPSKRRPEADCTEQEPTKRRNPSRLCKVAQNLSAPPPATRPQSTALPRSHRHQLRSFTKAIQVSSPNSSTPRLQTYDTQLPPPPQQQKEPAVTSGTPMHAPQGELPTNPAMTNTSSDAQWTEGRIATRIISLNSQKSKPEEKPNEHSSSRDTQSRSQRSFRPAGSMCV